MKEGKKKSVTGGEEGRKKESRGERRKERERRLFISFSLSPPHERRWTEKRENAALAIPGAAAAFSAAADADADDVVLVAEKLDRSQRRDQERERRRERKK